MEMSYVFDVADPAELADYSYAVLVGRVEEAVGENPPTSTIPDSPGHPQTQFSVEVGILEGEDTDRGVSRGESVTVDQRGGTDPETGKDVVVIAAVPAEQTSAEHDDRSSAAAKVAFRPGY